MKATAIDLPIWIENTAIDLKICMYDRLYQDVVRVLVECGGEELVLRALPDGTTCLYIASVEGHVDVVRELRVVRAPSFTHTLFGLSVRIF